LRTEQEFQEEKKRNENAYEERIETFSATTTKR
jgi:hypothetical protein